ncbi:hypothetical protein NL676_039805 [Syzygium grande]|nr:hypothetical protein NL676_039805 [Syzygium grande]
MASSYCNRFYPDKPEFAARRIEAIGYQVGHQLSERYTMERPRFSDHLEAIKFICKDFWSEVFEKQIDNLKTNHRIHFCCKIIVSVGLLACPSCHHLKWVKRVTARQQK